MDKKELISEITKEINESYANISLVIENLDNNENLVSYNSENKMVSASIIKVPIMIAILEMVDRGEVSLSSIIEVSDASILDDSKVFEYGPSKYTLDELLVWMIINSDNTATNCLIDFVTMDRINDFCVRHSLKNTILERKMLDFQAIKNGKNNYTSAGDMKTIYKAIFDRNMLNADLGYYAISVLRRQRAKGLSMRYINDEIVVAHKTGSLDFLKHDVGIFYLKDVNYYFGAFVTEAPDEEYGKKWIGRVSKLVYEYYANK
ncbi:serine hydrolase [Clostridium sp. DL1XJH146]